MASVLATRRPCPASRPKGLARPPRTGPITLGGWGGALQARAAAAASGREGAKRGVVIMPGCLLGASVMKANLEALGHPTEVVPITAWALPPSLELQTTFFRRDILKRGAASLALFALLPPSILPYLAPQAARASNWSAPQFSESGGGIPFKSDDGEFKLEWPSGWQELQDVNPEISVKASYINPDEPGETFAIFVVDTDKGSMQEFGTPAAYGKFVASQAPNYACKKAGSHTSNGVLYYDLLMVAGGGTAGRFGSAVEVLSIGIRRGKEYTARGSATTFRYSKRSVKGALDAAVGSFEIL
mmetsp:Transcript_57712/g.182809  ORF Transcript_57712/g.182809 Transcript_57712/m.182809 type:complete len:301 (-) Transcript_57712:2099-3001(-)